MFGNIQIPEQRVVPLDLICRKLNFFLFFFFNLKAAQILICTNSQM